MNNAADDPTNQPQGTHPPIREFYQPLLTLAIHGQENKWWMLYIYLMFNSILILSCSTVLVAQGFGLVHQVALTAFCLVGAFVDFCWLFMASDYIAAGNLYNNIARDAEDGMPTGIGRPLQQRDSQRATKSFLGTLKFVSMAMPVAFIAIYVVLFMLTWRLCFGPLA